MIYLKDEKTGVMVRSQDSADGVAFTKRNWTAPVGLYADEAESLLRGLLRWKLETLGNDQTDGAMTFCRYALAALNSLEKRELRGR